MRVDANILCMSIITFIFICYAVGEFNTNDIGMSMSECEHARQIW